MEGLVKPFCKVGVVVGDQGLGAGCGVGSSPSCSPLGVGLRVRKIPMRLASPGVLVELEVRGGGGVCTPTAGLPTCVGLDQQSIGWVLEDVWVQRVEKQFIRHRGVYMRVCVVCASFRDVCTGAASWRSNFCLRVPA